jgi:acetate kinase
MIFIIDNESSSLKKEVFEMEREDISPNARIELLSLLVTLLKTIARHSRIQMMDVMVFDPHCKKLQQLRHLKERTS